MNLLRLQKQLKMRKYQLMTGILIFPLFLQQIKTFVFGFGFRETAT